jgi:F420-0:gamma-glutamyl ligase
MWCEGKWIQLEDIMLSEVVRSPRQRSHDFSHMWKVVIKEKYAHLNKNDHTQSHM